MTTAHPSRDGNGIPAAEPVAVPSSLSENPRTLENRIALLEEKIIRLEAEHARFINALHFAGKFIMTNPASKMILMSLPKEMKEKLQQYFGA